ncbi:tetratricopeptide repeat protein [Cytophagaceae bacterium ABcell3]|nr:tetratricopeptide repeat protein [Cytophagaceae bacterium ABcell3]
MEFRKLTLTCSLALSLFSVANGQSVQEGKDFILNEQYEKAKGSFYSLIKEDSSEPDFYYYLGETFLLTQQIDSAKWAFEKGLSLSEKSALNHAGLGKATFFEDEASAKASFEKALRLTKSKKPEVLLSVAEFYVHSEYKDLTYAQELLDRALKFDDKNIEAWLLYGDLFLQQNDGTKVMEKYNQAIYLDSNNPKALYKLGQLYSRARNNELAMDNFKKAIDANPEFAPAYKEIGELHYKAKKYDEAIDAYKVYLEKAGDCVDNTFRYASFLFLNKDYKSAKEVLEPLADKDNVNPVAFRLLAYGSYETEDFENGLAYMEKFWETGYEKVLANDYEYYAKLLRKNGNDSLAVNNFYTAIEKDNNKVNLYSEIADIEMANKNFEQAAQAYASRIENGGGTAQDYLSLGRAFYSGKDFEQADSVFAKLIELRPELTIGYMYRGRANANMDPESEEGLAKPYYEKVIEIAGENKEKHKRDLIEAHSYLGYLYLINDENAEALHHWKVVKELDPSNKNAEQVINSLSQNN